jgi:hypothetical protein
MQLGSQGCLATKHTGIWQSAPSAAPSACSSFSEMQAVAPLVGGWQSYEQSVFCEGSTENINIGAAWRYLSNPQHVMSDVP